MYKYIWSSSEIVHDLGWAIFGRHKTHKDRIIGNIEESDSKTSQFLQKIPSCNKIQRYAPKTLLERAIEKYYIQTTKSCMRKEDCVEYERQE